MKIFAIVASFGICIALPGFATIAQPAFTVNKLAQVEYPVWGFDFLSPTKIIFTQRNGLLSTLDLTSKEIKAIGGEVPKVWATGQGGLLDVRVRKNNKSANPKIYLSYSLPTKAGGTTALTIAELEGEKLTQAKMIFQAEPESDNTIHFGSRIEFDEKGFLFLSIGDRNERKLAQDLNTHLGKIIRLQEDGSIPTDNPFAKVKGARAEIWTLGHRSPQGLAIDPKTNNLWEAEMGPRGGDEINLLKPGANYGWPTVTFGREYWGPRIGEGTSKAGLEDPIVHWVPSISPSGIAVYQGDKFPAWRGSLFLACLSGLHLRRLEITAGKISKQEELLAEKQLRFRHVRAGPDGFLYLSTDDGQILRLENISPKL